MEDKTIKVRCVNNDAAKDLLNIDKVYISHRENEKCYEIIDERGNKGFWGKTRFEKVEDALMVECIDNSNQKRELTINKKYPVIKVKAKGYLIENDIGNVEEYNLWRFKQVEQPKEVKEYSLMDLLDFPVGTKFNAVLFNESGKKM